MARLEAVSRAAALIARARTLKGDLDAVCAESSALIRRGRERRLASTYSRLRVIRGGSGAAIVTSLITDARLCLACIAVRSDVSSSVASDLLRGVARTLRIRVEPHRCDGCLLEKTTFSIYRSVHP